MGRGGCPMPIGPNSVRWAVSTVRSKFLFYRLINESLLQTLIKPAKSLFPSLVSLNLSLHTPKGKEKRRTAPALLDPRPRHLIVLSLLDPLLALSSCALSSSRLSVSVDFPLHAPKGKEKRRTAPALLDPTGHALLFVLSLLGPLLAPSSFAQPQSDRPETPTPIHRLIKVLERKLLVKIQEHCDEIRGVLAYW